MKLFVFILVVLSGISGLLAQVPSASITCVSGCGEISFYFNTLKKYNDGVSSPVVTHLQVRYDDNGDPAADWALYIDTDNPTIDCDDNGQTLDLNTIEITPSCPTCAAAGATVKGTQVLPGPPLPQPFPDPYNEGDPSIYEFITGGPPNPAPAALYDIELTWHCGKNLTGGGSSVFRKEPGYYSVNVNIHLITNH